MYLLTEAISTDIILDFTRRIVQRLQVATGNSATAIVELGRGIIHVCLANKEAYKRGGYAPHPPPGSEIELQSYELSGHATSLNSTVPFTQVY
ncbi:hypothetical protein ADUPG1_006046 [Aduncisulcus paluster]|uniref:Uncharacterized protein n=1 Tax=Aduncisulcus paluster TaxID=2918883 RepID=A0ABQ5KJN1_9EUKA|nr:hypothetical protein ADUPG1_006046 [Aduncisulcus paluster]